MHDDQVGFIGLGLIGGSIAKAIKARYPACTITAYDSSRDALSLACREGIVDKPADGITSAFSACHIIFLCAPVSYNVSYLHTLKNIISPDCLITDVGSVKTGIHREIEKLGMESCFIGGHPMAGSEKTGFSHAVPHLLENAYYILTPTSLAPDHKLSFYKELIASLGALPLVLDYREHDYITAAISHLPHILASSLVTLVRNKDSRNELMKYLAAGGFKDITRIASSSPTMWQQICLTNRENITALLDDYIENLLTVKEYMNTDNEDALYRFFEEGRDYRNTIPGASRGPIQKVFEVYCDIVDEEGVLASIATLLAKNHISIKNIGIISSREFEKGVLRIDFHQEESSKKALAVLKEHGYAAFER